MPALLALAAAAVFGAADFTGGQATRRSPVLVVTIISNATGALLAIALVAVVDGRTSAAGIVWGAAAGASGLVGLVLLYQGLAIGPNRFVSPVSAVLAAVFPVVVGLGAGERPDALGVAGLALAAPAIWLVAGGRGLDGVDRRTLATAVGAGLGFGLFFVFLARTPDDAGALPLLAARVTSTSILLAAVVGRSSSRSGQGPEAWPLAVGAGVLDMTANALFLWSTVDGDLSVVGALVNLYPVTTVLLAIGLLGERLGRSQAIGLALAVSAAALLGS